MAPRVTFQMEGSLRKKIFDNSQILWPIIAENKLTTLEGQNPSIKTLDRESKVIVEATSSSVKTQFIYAVDVDDKPGNGRIYVEDEFVFDPKTKLFDCSRNFRLSPGADTNAWKNFSDHLIDRQSKRPFNPDNPDVRKFFEKVVLELPTPVEVEATENKGKEDPMKIPDVSLPDPVFLSLTPPNPPYNLEASHFRRMSAAFPILGAAFEKIPASLELLKEGMSFQRTGFLKMNSAWEKLHRLTSSDPSLHFLSGALISLSKGDLKSARLRLMPLRASEPAADYLIGWIDEYEKALKNLYLLRPARALALEETARRLNANGAWLSWGGETIQPEQVRRLFQTIERKIVTGEADTLGQALNQFSSYGSTEEAALAKKLLSKNFAQEGLGDLTRVSGLPAPLADPLLLTVAREKWVPLGYASASLLMDDLGEYSKENAVALASRKSLGLVWGRAPFADQLDFTLRQGLDGLSDPVLIGSLMLGQGAFRLSQRYALARYGGLGLRTTLAATTLGLTAEAPAFELGHRVLTRSFVGEAVHTDFLRASARNWLTFGALRGAGLGVQLNSARILSLSPYSPFGVYTLPVVEHGASFGALHLMNEGERGLGLRPASGTWGSRLASDGVFYLQVGLASYLAGLGASPRLTGEIRGLEALNRLYAEASTFQPTKREVKLLPPHIEEISNSGEPETPAIPLNVPEPLPAPSALGPFKILQTGESILATGPNEIKLPRREEVFLKIPNYGEVAAYTHEGIDKKQMDGQRAHAVNEDAFGLTVDSEGRPFLMVADGMGGHGLGEVASKLGVEKSIEAVKEGRAGTPGMAFQEADAAIRDFSKAGYDAWLREGANGNPPSSGTVASAVRINPDGTVEAALTGDARLWVLRSKWDGSYEVIEPVLPHFEPTAWRLNGTLKNTLQMNGHEKANMVLSGLGQSNLPHLTKAFDYGLPGNPKAVSNQIYDSILTLPASGDPSVPREPFKLQKGDALLLMSDGIATFFNRAQMAETLRGKTDAQEMLKAIQNESNYRFALFLGLIKAPIDNGQRKKVKVGSFAGQYMDARGKIYASKDLNDTNLIGQVGRDNVVALIYRHDPIQAALPTSLGGAPAEAPTTVAVLPGEHHSLTDLLGQTDPAGVLEGIRLRRGLSEASSNYWLLMPGGIELSLTREFGDSPGVPFKISGGEHHIAGEIGETIRLQLAGQELPLYTMFLDGPRGEGQRLPIAHLAYGGREAKIRFRSTTPDLNIGRLFNPDLFEAADPLTADHHFDVAATLKGPDRGYQITSRSPHGIYWGEKFLAPGQDVFVLPGRYEIRPADSNAGSVPSASPIEITLPKIEVLFPEWLPKEVMPVSSSDFSRGANTPSSPPIFESWFTSVKEISQRFARWARNQIRKQ